MLLIPVRTPLILLLSQPKFRELHASTLKSMAQTSGIVETGAQEKKLGEDSTAKGPERIDCNKELGALSCNIIPHILNIYGCSATARDFEIYAPNATFEDPLMCAHGVKQIKSSFYSLPKVFSEAKIVEYSVQENENSPGNGEILIDNKQHYKIMGKNIDLTTLIKLQVEQGKVIRHEDWWNKKPLWNRHTVHVPLVGHIVEGMRRCSMLLTHPLMGCGKDPNP